MKPLRTGLAAGLLAGGAAAANKLVGELRSGGGGAGSSRVVTGLDGRAAPAKGGALGGISEAVGALVARRAARRTEANRPAWVVAAAPTTGAGGGGSGGSGALAVPARPSTAPRAAAARPAASRPAAAPSAGRRLPTLESLRPPSAKAVGASVGKYAVKQAGKAIGKAAADRVGKAIEVIETLEKVVAAATQDAAASRPDMTPSGPGVLTDAVVATASVVIVPPSAPTAGADAPAKPRGTLVSVRKFERGPRVVVGSGVTPPTAVDDAAVEAAVDVVAEAVGTAVTEAAVEAAVEVVAEAIEAAVTEADTATDEAAVTGPAALAPVAADGDGDTAVKAKTAPKRKAPAKKKAATPAPAKAKAAPDDTPESAAGKP